MSALLSGTGKGLPRPSTPENVRAGVEHSRGPASCGATQAGWRPVSGASLAVTGRAVAWSGVERKDDSLWILLISLCTMATLLGLYNLRSLDDNRLTSWWWVFDNVAPQVFFLILAVAISLAYGISRLAWHERVAVPLLFVAAFLLPAVMWQGPEVIVDAARHFMQAKYVELHGIGYFLAEWGNAIPAWTDLPLPPLVHGLIFRVFGESRLGVQVFTSLLFAGTVVLTYLTGKALWSRELGLYAGILLLGMPYLLAQVPLMMVDVAAMFFLTLAVFATIVAIARGGALLCTMAAVAITLAMLAKYSNWLMLTVLPVIVLAHAGKDWKTALGRGVVVATGVLVLMGIFVSAKYDVIVDQIRLLISFQMPALGGWEESLLSTFFFQIHPFITVAAVLSVYLAVKKKDVKYAIIAWMLLLVMALGLRRIRYMLVLLPMLALMAAYGLEIAKRTGYRKFIVASTAITAVLIVTAGYLPFFQGTSANNIKQAGAYLDSVSAGTTEVHVLPQTRSSVNPVVAVPILDLFTGQQLVYHANAGAGPAERTLDRLPWRWTWEVDNTGYLPSAVNTVTASTVVVIQSEGDQPFPGYLAERIDGYLLRKEFAETSRVFRFRTVVRIYQRA